MVDVSVDLRASRPGPMSREVERPVSVDLWVSFDFLLRLSGDGEVTLIGRRGLRSSSSNTSPE